MIPLIPLFRGYTRLTTALALATVVGAASCSAAGGDSDPGRPGTDRSGTPDAPLSASLALPEGTVAQGSAISADLAITNRSSDPVTITTQGGCSPHWAVVLQGPQAPAAEPVFSAECGSNPLVLAPGTTHVTATISSRYSSCRAATSAPSPGGAPGCEQTGPPPLPAGMYETRFFSDAKELPVPPPIRVEIAPR